MPKLSNCRITSKAEIFEMFGDKLIKYDILNEKTDEEEVESPYYILSMPFLGIDLFTYLFQFSYFFLFIIKQLDCFNCFICHIFGIYQIFYVFF